MRTVAGFYGSRGIRPGSCVAVAFSGGADSVALLAATRAAGYACVALHCNFHLRGDESDRDENFARSMAERFGCEFRLTHFDVPERMESTGESVEMACRELRYEWFAREFERAAGAWSCVAVAHHADDSVETFFLNFARGTGLRGLGGIAPVRGIFLRPLLGVSRSDILAYLDAEGLGYVTDSSNLSNDYRRNKLRNVVLPLFEREFPSLRKGVAVTARNLRDDMELLQGLLEEAAPAYVDPRGRIDLAKVAQTRYAGGLLYHLLNRGEGTYGRETAEAMLRNPRSGAFYEAENGRGAYIIDHGYLLPCDSHAAGQEGEDDMFDLSGKIPSEGKTCIEAPLALEFEVLGREGFAPRRDADVLWLDADALAAAVNEGERPVLRRWREGDRMNPFGMKGSRLLSDLFSDARLALPEKRRLWLLEVGDRILWVPGLRASRHFPVTDVTKNVLKVTRLKG